MNDLKKEIERLEAINAQLLAAAESVRVAMYVNDSGDWALKRGYGAVYKMDAAIEAAKRSRHGHAPAPVAQGETVAYSDALWAMESAHWLGGTLAERIRLLCEERELAIEGRHPVQIARAAAPAPVAQPLTDAQKMKLWHGTSNIVPTYNHYLHYARAVERACAEVWGVKLVDATGQEDQPAAGRPPAST